MPRFGHAWLPEPEPAAQEFRTTGFQRGVHWGVSNSTRSQRTAFFVEPFHGKRSSQTRPAKIAVRIRSEGPGPCAARASGSRETAERPLTRLAAARQTQGGRVHGRAASTGSLQKVRHPMPLLWATGLRSDGILPAGENASLSCDGMDRRQHLHSSTIRSHVASGGLPLFEQAASGHSDSFRRANRPPCLLPKLPLRRHRVPVLSVRRQSRRPSTGVADGFS